METNRHNALHYMLIILLMFAPVRGVMAMQQTHCDMGSHVTGQTAESSAEIYADSGNHDMEAMSMTPDSGMQKFEKSHDCCSANSSCANDCDMHISVSLLTQKSSYIPNFANISHSVALTTDLIKKGFTPPFRPPLVFHS